MAAIIRVKRRLDEDPAEGLIVQYKRCRTDGFQTDETKMFCLSLVTTVESKDAHISRHIQKALRRQQLQTSYKAHNSKRSLQTRAEKKAAVKASRYRIVNSKRALAVDSADSLSDSEGEHSTEDTPTGLKERLCQATRSAKSESSGLDRVSGSDSEVVTSSEASPSSSHDSVEAASRTAPDSIGSVIHVYDVEQDSTEGRESDSQPLSQSPDPGSGITLNGERLLRQQVPAAVENNYVYDLYYINSNGQQYDFRDLENILSIEALHDELVCESDRQEECNDVYDDDDDSNDENNWRNDYPDEDPDQSDREQDEFGFGFGYDTLQIEQPQSYHCRGDDDFLADAMGTRLHLFGESSSSIDEDEEDDSGSHDGRGSYYKAYMRRVTHDLLAEDSD